MENKETQEKIERVYRDIGSVAMGVAKFVKISNHDKDWEEAKEGILERLENIVQLLENSH